MFEGVGLGWVGGGRVHIYILYSIYQHFPRIRQTVDAVKRYQADVVRRSSDSMRPCAIFSRLTHGHKAEETELQNGSDGR